MATSTSNIEFPSSFSAGCNGGDPYSGPPQPSFLRYLIDGFKRGYRRNQCRRGIHRYNGSKELYITAGFAYWEKHCCDCSYVWYVLKEPEDEKR